jgi:glyoxylate reductase
VLVLAPLAAELSRRLAAVCEVVERPSGELDEAAVAALVPGFDGLLALLVHRVGEAVFAAAPTLAMVANHAVGVDNVDLAAAARHGVVVTNTPGVLTDDTADLTWALILAVTRRLVEADAYVRAGRWTGWRPDLLIGRSLTGATLGVVGAGRIGQAVLGRAAGFRMRLLYASRRPLPAEREAALGVARRELPELLAEADVVSLHVPLGPETRHLIDGPALARMKPTAVLVNTSRGPVVDEAALAAALAAGRLGGAGLDVFEEEPRIHPGLMERPDVVLLPHVGSATAETRFRMAELCVEDLTTFFGQRRVPARSLAGAPEAGAGAETLTVGSRT